MSLLLLLAVAIVLWAASLRKSQSQTGGAKVTYVVSIHYKNGKVWDNMLYFFSYGFRSWNAKVAQSRLLNAQRRRVARRQQILLWTPMQDDFTRAFPVYYGHLDDASPSNIAKLEADLLSKLNSGSPPINWPRSKIDRVSIRKYTEWTNDGAKTSIPSECSQGGAC